VTENTVETDALLMFSKMKKRCCNLTGTEDVYKRISLKNNNKFFFALTELAGVLCVILIGMERKESVWCYKRI
jgi:hypothetical protein